MKQLLAFTKKEGMELFRTGKFYILLCVFLLFGIMNPAIAKLTPWLMEMMSESLADAGLVVTEVKVDALTSWTQFYKNVPIALAIFLLMSGGILTGEYQRGTLINMLTKGLARWRVIVSKEMILFLLWTLDYWFCYGITYAYNAWYWDNSIVSDLFLSAACFYLLGIWLISLLLFMSVLFSNSSTAVAGTGGIFFALYFAGMVPKIKEYLPVQLADGANLLTEAAKREDFQSAVFVTVLLIVLDMVLSVICFNRKNV